MKLHWTPGGCKDRTKGPRAKLNITSGFCGKCATRSGTPERTRILVRLNKGIR